MGIPTTPVNAAKQGFDKRAHLEVVKPANYEPKEIPLIFNPTEYVVSKQNTFQEIPIPGLNAPPIQFVRGGSEKLTFEAMLDTSDDMSDVRKWVKPLRKLLAISPEVHAPPVVKFKWEDFEFVGVIESLNITYTLFAEDGYPVRAKCSFGLKQYTTVAEQRAETQKQSPDVEKTYVVVRGDTLSRIAEQAYGDPAPWRQIAKANHIADPRVLEPGQVLTIPRRGARSRVRTASPTRARSSPAAC